MLDRHGFSLHDVLDGNVPELDSESMVEAAWHENDEPGTYSLVLRPATFACFR